VESAGWNGLAGTGWLEWAGLDALTGNQRSRRAGAARSARAVDAAMNDDDGYEHGF
jgi:hypothetical protein